MVTLSFLALAFGILGLVAMVIAQTLFISRIFITDPFSPWILVTFALVGAWLLLVSVAARNTGILTKGLVWLGMLSGLGMMIFLVMYFLGGITADFQEGMASIPIPVMISFSLGFAGYIGWPVWAIWLGRVLLKR